MRRHHAGTVARSCSIALATIVLSAGCITNSDPAASYEEVETDAGTAAAPSDSSTASDASETSTAEPSGSDEPSPPTDGGAPTPPPSSKDAGAPTPPADAAPAGSPCGTTVSFKTNVAPLFATACSGCHSNKLSTASGAYSFLTTQSSGCGPLVVSGNAAASTLVRLLQGSTCGTRMPKGGPYMTSTQLATITGWICQGAKND